jgi:DNA mismatch repair protein MutL
VQPVIAVLPAHVIDQIAAGEVIERPASVVKELLDNAIDAGARSIAIETTAGGRGVIRVVDDGCGMSAQDAVFAFERHATSKLRTAEDLWGLPTLGFRGEALPAIASVSRVTLTTRREGDLSATRVEIAAGRLVQVTEVGAPVGTCVEVADLFYNVPARLKFLRAEATEASHVTELVARIAMVRPELHVKLRHSGRVALDVPPDRDAIARAHALLGVRVAAKLVTATGEEAGFRVTAHIAAPELAQTTARGVQLFVDKRPVRDRGLLHAVAMGYGELVPRGRYPVAIVQVDAPAGAVDINVHPQKHEVRFSDPGAVAAAVRHVVQAAVARAPWRDAGGAFGGATMMSIANVVPPRAEGLQASGFRLQAGRKGQLGLDEARSWVRNIKEGLWASRAAEISEARSLKPEAGSPSADAVPWDEPELAHGSVPAATPGFFASLRYLGQLDLTYLACEGEGELVLIDQHIAHERVELVRLQAQGEREVATQRMLFPATIEARPEVVELAERVKGVLARAGFEAEPFGKTTLAVKAVPSGVRHGDPAQLLARLLETWADGGAPTEEDLVERVLAEIACHSVVRAGDRLSQGEVEALLRAMDGASYPAHGPHGRPVLLRLPLTEIARRFGR